MYIDILPRTLNTDDLHAVHIFKRGTEHGYEFLKDVPVALNPMLQQGILKVLVRDFFSEKHSCHCYDHSLLPKSCLREVFVVVGVSISSLL